MSFHVGLGIIRVIHEFDLNKISAMLTLCHSLVKKLYFWGGCFCF